MERARAKYVMNVTCACARALSTANTSKSEISSGKFPILCGNMYIMLDLDAICNNNTMYVINILLIIGFSMIIHKIFEIFKKFFL